MAAKLIGEHGSRQLDRYELIAELASGGMATVYLARLGGLAGFQRLVAIKHLHPHLQHEEQFVQMFLDEARLAAGIHHPHVVPILEVAEGEAGHYLVMEYIEGDTLARLIARAASSASENAFPPSIAVRVMIHTLDGLHAAHELTDDFGVHLQLVHRDVSPQNVLVGVDGLARITDFGVARAASRIASTHAGQFKGKLAYMAPEQAAGGELDRRTDVFAAGIVAWEALCMRRLFRGQSDAETLNRVLFTPIPRVREFNPSIPESIDDVVHRALQRAPADRFATCLAFAEALEVAAEKARMSASVREVAAFVQRTLGQDIAAQRDRVRTWLSRSEPSQAWPDMPSSSRSVPSSPRLLNPTSLSAALLTVSGVPDLSASSAAAMPTTSKPLKTVALGTVAGLAAAAVVLVVAGSAIVAWKTGWVGGANALPAAPTAAAAASPVPSASAAVAVASALVISAPVPSASAPPTSSQPVRSDTKSRNAGTSVPAGDKRSGGSDDDLSTNPYR